jgi:hypothetical protein
LKAQTAFEETHGQHNHEGKEGADDPADEAFEDEEHRVSDGAGRESGFAEEYHSAVKGRGKGRGIGERGSSVDNSRVQGGGRREEGGGEEGGRRRRRGRKEEEKREERGAGSGRQGYFRVGCGVGSSMKRRGAGGYNRSFGA